MDKQPVAGDDVMGIESDQIMEDIQRDKMQSTHAFGESHSTEGSSDR